MAFRTDNNSKEWAKAFLASSQQGHPGHDSCMQPCMARRPRQPQESGASLDAVAVSAALRETPLPARLVALFNRLGRTDIECYRGPWTLLSIDKIQRMRAIYEAAGQNRAVNFAMSYLGMGHVAMACYDPETHRVYYKSENGANGYEADENHQKAVAYVPIAADLHPLEHWEKMWEDEQAGMEAIPFYSG